MKKLKHTPGPWKAFKNEYFYDIKCSDKIGGEEIYKYSPHICMVIQDTNYDHTRGEYTEEANARLIATAPEMLEALIYFVKRVREGSIRSKTTYNMYVGIIESATGLTIEEVLAE